MTRAAPSLAFDVATALSQGQRDQQEDAVIADFPLDGDVGFAVLADGMGGHAAGDIASKIVVTEVFSELKLQSGEAEHFESDISNILRAAAQAANDCVRLHTEHHPGSEGMGATLVAPVLVGNRLYWVSVGDSPLFLYRDGALTQLNEDHSLAGQIDLLVKRGLMDAETAENHPDRHCLTSVLIGDTIARIDCPPEPLVLREGDIVVAASDGLQFLDNSEIAELIADKADMPSADIARYLMTALDALDDPHQDNTSLCVIKATTGQNRLTPVHVDAETRDAIQGMLAAQPSIPDTAFPGQQAARHDRPLAQPGMVPLAQANGAAAADHTGRNALSVSHTSAGRKITVVARKTLGGLSMLYQLRRPSEKSA